jgi:N-acetylmuramoyl-L-alanine amidase
MENWCAANGYDPYHEDDFVYDQACMAFFLHEVIETWEKRVLTEGGEIDGVFYPPLSACETLDQKTESFWRLYERPGTPHEDWRREMAHEALRLYRGDTPAEDKPMPYQRIVISSGHSLHCRGASGVLDEVNEARRVVEHLADELTERGVDVVTFHDDTSKDQSTNLSTICAAHNSQTRDLDISVHFNAYVETEKPMGCEVLYVTQEALAGELSAAIASCGFIDRGAKYRDDLYVLNHTEMPCVLIETCFCDSEADAEVYSEQFDAICSALADVLGGEQATTEPEPLPPGETIPPPIERPPLQRILGRVDIEISGPVRVIVNRVPVT